MKVRKCTSLLLGVAVPVPEPRRFELPPPPGFELPPPAHESHAGLASKASSSSSPEPCVQNLDPWDLFDELDLSDPQEEERFVEEYSVPVARRASLLLPSSMSVGPIKEVEEDMVNDVEEEDMAVDMVNGPILEPRTTLPRQNVGRKTARKKESKPKTKKGKENAEESDGSGRGETMYTCKKNDGKKWSCQRPVSQPDTLCSYHSEPKLPGSLRPRRKRVAALGKAADEFYYYDGYGPSRSMRHRGSSSRSVPEPAPAEEKEEAQLPAEEHVHIVTPGQDRAHVPRCENDDDIVTAGYVEDISTDDDDVKRKNPVKKRKRKPVNTRSINSLM